MLLPYIRSSSRKAFSSPARSPSTSPASSTARLYAASTSTRRQSGDRRRQPVPGPDGVEVAVVDTPREDASPIGVERVEEAPIAAEILVSQARPTLLRCCGERVVEHQRALRRNVVAGNGAV